MMKSPVDDRFVTTLPAPPAVKVRLLAPSEIEVAVSSDMVSFSSVKSRASGATSAAAIVPFAISAELISLPSFETLALKALSLTVLVAPIVSVSEICVSLSVPV